MTVKRDVDQNIKANNLYNTLELGNICMINTVSQDLILMVTNFLAILQTPQRCIGFYLDSRSTFRADFLAISLYRDHVSNFIFHNTTFYTI